MISIKHYIALLVLAASLTSLAAPKATTTTTTTPQTDPTLVMDCVLDRSRLLGISHELLQENLRLRDERKNLRELLQHLLNSNLQLGEDQAAVLQQNLALVDSLGKLTAQQDILAQERDFLQQKHSEAVQESNKMEEHYTKLLKKADKTLTKWVKAKNEELAKALKERDNALLRIKALEEENVNIEKEQKETAAQCADDQNKLTAAFDKVNILMRQRVAELSAERAAMLEELETQKEKYKQALHDTENILDIHELAVAEYENVIREKEESYLRTAKEKEEEYNAVVKSRGDTVRELEHLAVRYAELSRGKTTMVHDFEEHVQKAEKEFMETILKKDHELKTMTEEKEKTVRELKMMKAKNEEEKQATHEYYQRAVYNATLTMDRMKAEIEEKDKALSQEKEKRGALEEQSRTKESAATHTINRLNEMMKDKDQQLAEQKEKTKGMYERCVKIMDLAARTHQQMSEKMKEMDKQLWEEAEEAVDIEKLQHKSEQTEMVTMDETKNEEEPSKVKDLNQVPEDGQEPAADERDLMLQETPEEVDNDTHVEVYEVVLYEEEFVTDEEKVTVDRPQNEVKLSDVRDLNQLPEYLQERVAGAMDLFEDPEMRQEDSEKLDVDMEEEVVLDEEEFVTDGEKVTVEAAQNEAKLSDVRDLSQLLEDLQERVAGVMDLFEDPTLGQQDSEKLNVDIEEEVVLYEEEFVIDEETVTVDRAQKEVKLSDVRDLNQLLEDLEERVAGVMDLFEDPEMRQEDSEKLDVDMAGEEVVLYEEEFVTDGEKVTVDRAQNEVKLSNVRDLNQFLEDVQERVSGVMDLFEDPTLGREDSEKLDIDMEEEVVLDEEEFVIDEETVPVDRAQNEVKLSDVRDLNQLLDDLQERVAAAMDLFERWEDAENGNIHTNVEEEEVVLDEEEFVMHSGAEQESEEDEEENTGTDGLATLDEAESYMEGIDDVASEEVAYAKVKEDEYQNALKETSSGVTEVFQGYDMTHQRTEHLVNYVSGGRRQATSLKNTQYTVKGRGRKAALARGKGYSARSD